ncbi:hypothetical protein F2Q69_00056446 [Brassica cretica]|uniref:Uncharacterized protein n=1 Tax=Brassica cretica TaxID=69181 RepID=A0A8S9MZH3_BRACR|nr:hypothetical protein F2Q69_00056446 [Brassica cretica]
MANKICNEAGADLEFLRHCGWEVEPYYVEQLTIFTMFLKKAVFKGLTAFVGIRMEECLIELS